MKSNDSADKRVERFKVFAKTFFLAIKNQDRLYLRDHVEFPVPVASFSFYDESLRNQKSISRKMFLSKLSKLFPAEITEDMNKAEYSISEHAGQPTYYFVTIYDDSGGVDSNVQWSFIEKSNSFSFVRFTAEAG